MSGEALKVARGIWHELKRIADCLESLIPEPEIPAPVEPDPTCPHPPEYRTDFGLTHGVPDWECRACRFRSQP